MTGTVLVVGAGVAGLALARALDRVEVPCTVVERRDQVQTETGMALNLPGNATRALRHLGVLDTVLPHAVPIDRREYRNARGHLLFAVDDATFWRDVGPPVCVAQGQLVRALRGPGTAVVRYGVSTLTVDPKDDHVDVRFDGRGPPERFDLVVGADGVHSTIRRACLAGGTRPSRMTRSCWRLVADDPGLACWTAWSGPSATFVLMPLAGCRVYGYAATTHGTNVGAHPEWLLQAATGFPAVVTRCVAGALSRRGRLVRASVDEVDPACWHRGRLLLVGDAAHAMGPVWAQGAALALEDALVLARILGEHADWSAVGAALERSRRVRVEHVRAATDGMSRLAGLPTWLRDATAPVMGPRAYRRAYAPLRADPVSPR